MPYVKVTSAKGFSLKDIDPDQDGDLDKEAAAPLLAGHQKRIAALQERLYAEGKQSLLVMLQAIDTGGKDGTIRGVFSGVNPQGCRVWSFGVPTAEELDHDVLWRYHLHTPARGMIGIFNRSPYEEVLVVRVKNLVPKRAWSKRYDEICDFEQILANNGTRIVKIFLHISRDEQRERLQDRLDDPDKHWKFNPADLDDRALWDDYQEAFQDAIAKCASPHAPWYVIPANRKWYRNVLVARIIADTLEDMNPQWPEPAKGLDSIVIPK